MTVIVVLQKCEVVLPATGGADTPPVHRFQYYLSVAPEQAPTHDLPKSRVLEGLPQGNMVILTINPWAFLLTNFQDSYFSDSQEKAS